MEKQLKEFIKNNVSGFAHDCTLDNSGVIELERDGVVEKIQGIKHPDTHTITLHCEWFQGEMPEFVKALLKALEEGEGNG